MHFVKKGGTITLKIGLLGLINQKEVKQVEITKIRVGGFRNISDVELNFENSIISFVGLNGYGKSNVIDAIGFGFDFIFFGHLSVPIQFGFMGTINEEDPNVGFCGGLGLRYAW